jgi:hypothetical protein
MVGGAGENSSSSGSDTPIVVPRARRPQESSSIPIEQWVLPCIQKFATGLICITAPPGGGKTTALRHLAITLPSSHEIRLFDADQTNEAIGASQSAAVVLAAENVPTATRPLAHFELSPWTLDDCLEFLISRHRDKVSSVLRRMSADDSFASLDGRPALLATVMNRMAVDGSLISSRMALQQLVLRHI